MASKIYPKWKQAIVQCDATASLAGSGTTGVYAALVDTGTYIRDDAHEFYSSLSGVVGTDQELTSKTFVGGLFDAADTTHPSVTGSSAEAIVLYVKNAGANTTWRVVAYIDGISVTPNGGDIATVWNASGIFQL